MSSLLSIGQSGLLAAQVGLATTSHNITNANVPGYHRQVAVQSTTPGLDTGVGFVGTGTEVAQIKRYYDDFLNKRVLNAESSQAAYTEYYTQISQIDNMLADTTTGLSPALQDFFKGVQDANSNPSSVASRQAMLSSAESLASRFQGMAGRLSELRNGFSSKTTSIVNEINTYASRIADLNNEIAGLSIDKLRLPNDLLDQRDQLISELNKRVKVTVMPGDNNMLNVSIGTGQPMVVGNKPFELAVTTSPTDVSRLAIGYKTANQLGVLPESTFTGGSLGGLMDFRTTALDRAENQLGQIAASLAATFNSQHQLGIDLKGAAGGNFFNDIKAVVGYDKRNSISSTLDIQAVIKDGTQVTASTYDMNFDGTNLVLTRASDGKQTTITPFPQTGPQMIDGVEYTITGVPANGDHAEIRPVANAANSFSVALKDASKIALAAPIATSMPTTNTGTGKIDPGSVDAAYLQPGNALTAPLPLTYDSTANTLNGFPAGQDVTVTPPGGGTPVTYPAGTPVPFTDGAKVSFGGISFSISGKPANGDQFVISPNANGVGDNRNGVALAGLQSKNVVGGTATFQSGYAQMVNYVGNKARESQISMDAADGAVEQASKAQQQLSGVNLDEEAANLLRYQQAYQASGKVMQVASQLFDVLLTLGR
ncbi:flagellar hook-associated protein FlgK [Massilia sp. BJB1822]|uniref:flagellar hook-associated protein FlgK n=1 Tax=Massilia sp. BJB1822 TaxID=2744470 RepID=UPI001594B570|nr:flagellar hook-associated protein FlgK [Massilia sp. BJB1822]NVD98318.1 flagellar hook-associated protein FlgK [Massilia sp. BJB1822]